MNITPHPVPINSALDDGESTARYAEPEYIAYDEPANAEEIVFPNSWNVPANTHGFPEPVEEANPALFFNPDEIKRETIQAITQTVGVPSSGQPVRLIARNRRRTQLTIWTDQANTSPVYLNANQGSPLGGIGSGAVAIAPGSLPLILKATSEFYVSANSTCTVYFIEESRVSND